MIFFYKTFRDKMLPFLTETPVTGKDIRERFNRESGRKIGIYRFYLWMRRMEDDGLVVHTEHAEEFDGFNLKFRMYRRP